MSEFLPFQPEEYICTTCGGFKQLPLRFQFPPQWRRWCICDYDVLFRFFIDADKFSNDEPEEQETPSFNEFLDKFLDDEGKKLGKRIV